MTNVTPMGPRTLGAAIALPDSFLRCVEALGLEKPNWEKDPKAFTFRRRKYGSTWGVEIGLRIGRLWLNITKPPNHDSGHSLAPFLRTRAEAVAWAVAFAQQHGFTPMEEVRPKEPRPVPSLSVVPGGQP